MQEGEFERVGDEETQRVDVRIVAATNKDLLTEVKSQRFREDLYYRLSVFPIRVPPLRERIDDIPALATHFIEQICLQMNRPTLALTTANLKLLQNYTWPGNIRELKNTLERAVILTPANTQKLNLRLAEQAFETVPRPAEKIVSEQPPGPDDYLPESVFRELEKDNLKKALIASKGKIAGNRGAAALLGIKPSTLAYRLDNFGIKAADFKLKSNNPN